jgi:CubicO group peptidase (beta-lactamase class C family)
VSTTELDAIVKREMSRLHIPGLAVGVLSGSEIVYENYIGLADSRNAVPVTSRTTFPLASISKQFTASAVLILMQDGHLDLDWPLASAIPDVSFPVSWTPITIRTLLNQTSGLPNFMAFIGLSPITRGHHKKRTAQEVVDIIRGKPLHFSPGEKFGYSNTNYYFLAEVIRAVSGQVCEDFLQARIFQPLSMCTTTTLDMLTSRENQATRYSKIGPFPLINRINVHPSIYNGSGGLESTLKDMLTWNIALNGEFPLSSATKSLMWSAPKMAKQGPRNYGFGWLVEETHPYDLVWHNGMIPGGAMCWMGRYRTTGLAVVALSNYADISNRNYPMQFAQMCKKVADNFHTNKLKGAIAIM